MTLGMEGVIISRHLSVIPNSGESPLANWDWIALEETERCHEDMPVLR